MTTEKLAHLNNAEYYDTYYRKPAWWFRFRYDTQIKRKTVLALIKKAGFLLSGQKVLEIGFGSGVVLFSFELDCAISGIEVSPSAVKIARQRAQRLGYEKVDMRLATSTLMPYPDASFDIVIASHVLEHVPSDSDVLREIRRVLRPGGIAVVIVPINERYHDPKHVRSYSLSSLEQISASSGLEPIVSLENELLYYVVEKFYFCGYNERWKIWGPALAAAFNIPFAILPFSICRCLDKLVQRTGLPPRQAGLVLSRTTNPTSPENSQIG